MSRPDPLLELWLQDQERKLLDLDVSIKRGWNAVPRKPDAYAGIPALGRSINRNPQTEGEDHPTTSSWRYNLLKLEPTTGGIRWRSLIPVYGSSGGNIFELYVGPEWMWILLDEGSGEFQLATASLNGDPLRWHNGTHYSGENASSSSVIHFPKICLASDGNLIVRNAVDNSLDSIASDLSVAWSYDLSGLFSGTGVTPSCLSRVSGGIRIASQGNNSSYPFVVNGYYALVSESGSLVSETVAPNAAYVGGMHDDEYGRGSIHFASGFQSKFQRLDEVLNAVSATPEVMSSSLASDGVYTAARGSGGACVVRKFSTDLTTVDWTINTMSGASGIACVAALPEGGCILLLKSVETIDGLTGNVFRLDADGDAVWTQYDPVWSSTPSNPRVRVGPDGFVYIAGPERVRNQTP